MEGSYKSAKESEFFGEKYSFDVAFKAPITRAAKVVPPSAAETAAAQKSPQAKAYAEFLKAVQKEDLAALKKLVSSEIGEAARPAGREEHAQDDQDDVRDGHPGPEGRRDGRPADLTVTGKQESNTANGVVHMVREGGAWKVQREEWKN